LPFVSERFEQKNDILEEIDRNERSFKIVAEKMIQKSSMLDNLVVDDLYRQNSGGNMSQSMPQSSGRRLMHFKQFDKVSNRFHGDVKVQQGLPFCIAALEDFIGIGSTDGSVRLFESHQENELKILTAKGLLGNNVTCLDIRRAKGDNLLHVVAGHAKGQVVLYEVKGLPKFEKKKLINMITFKVLKIVSDTHNGQVIQAKFYGDLKSDQKNI
jgi:hypothetical protein